MRGVILLALLAVAGCSEEPSFDERYDSAEKQIRTKAAQIDRDLRPRSDERPES